MKLPKSKFTAKELELAKSLIGHLTGPFKPEQFHDSYRKNVERLIEDKQKGRKIAIVKPPRQAPVIDLMEALKRSLESKAPAGAASHETPRSRSKGRKSTGRRKAA